jgi:hypothetical protein
MTFRTPLTDRLGLVTAADPSRPDGLPMLAVPWCTSILAAGRREVSLLYIR